MLSPFLPTAMLRSYLQSLYNVPDTKVTTLSNGLKVATEDSGIPTATVRTEVQFIKYG